MNFMKCTLAGFAGMLGLAASTGHAQDLNIRYGQILVPDGSESTSKLSRTNLGPVLVDGGSEVIELWAFNSDPNVDVTVGGLTVTGANPTDFYVQFNYNTVEAGGGVHSPVRITFNPSAAGIRSAIVTIQNNSLGSKSSYSFAISGEGVNSLPLATANISLGYEQPALAKTRFNKATGLYSVSWKLSAWNTGPIASPEGLVKFYYSQDSYFGPDDVEIGESVLKAIPAQVSGKAPKKKKLKLKAALENSTGRIFAVATIAPEVIQYNNLAGTGYSIDY